MEETMKSNTRRLPIMTPDTTPLRKLARRHSTTCGELVDELELRGFAVTTDANGRLACSPEAAASLDADPPSVPEALVPVALLAADGHGTAQPVGFDSPPAEFLAHKLAGHVRENEFGALCVPQSVARGLYAERAAEQDRKAAELAAERERIASAPPSPIRLLVEAKARASRARAGLLSPRQPGEPLDALADVMATDPAARREADRRVDRTNELARGIESGARYRALGDDAA